MVQTPVPVEEYLSTSYHPDVDYVGGYLEQRHTGEKGHGKLEWRVTFLLKRTRQILAFLETRLKDHAHTLPRTRYLRLRSRTR